MAPLTERRYPAGMAPYTPLTSPYPMSWPPLECNTCGAAEMTWAYPVRPVTWYRRVEAGQPLQLIRHEAQPWFACDRCWRFVQADSWDQLAVELGEPAGHFRALAAAKSDAPGYRWKPRR